MGESLILNAMMYQGSSTHIELKRGQAVRDSQQTRRGREKKKKIVVGKPSAIGLITMKNQRTHPLKTKHKKGENRPITNIRGTTDRKKEKEVGTGKAWSEPGMIKNNQGHLEAGKEGSREEARASINVGFTTRHTWKERKTNNGKKTTVKNE